MFSRLQEMRYVESRIRVRTVENVVRCLVTTTVTVEITQQDATAREVRNGIFSVSITRGVQKVLQLVYEKEPQTFKHSGIFQSSLLQHQCTFAIFLPCCLFLEKRILSPVHQTMLQQQL